ncbi:hypothetical protein [Streptomyces sp. CBMA29]|uniref:hypothetical protein n=1 Tax=Streptomyces sp. CBMA29 TaxID=1896314 RepID=UPI001661CC80|nr:hypothetical protein [Streptomyces sp. CBMA29]
MPESHMIGCGAAKTSPPVVVSVAVRPPSAVRATSRPSVTTPKVSCVSAGFRAAAAVLSTSSSWKPSVSARIRRSTSGRTFLYVAVSPSSVGAGSADGQVYDSFRPALSRVTSGADPPPDSSMPTDATAGATLPSGCRTRVLSTVFHSPPTRARTGRRCWSVSRLPAGSAYVSLDSVRSEVISTLCPASAASATAASRVSAVRCETPVSAFAGFEDRVAFDIDVDVGSAPGADAGAAATATAAAGPTATTRADASVTISHETHAHV